MRVHTVVEVRQARATCSEPSSLLHLHVSSSRLSSFVSRHSSLVLSSLFILVLKSVVSRLSLGFKSKYLIISMLAFVWFLSRVPSHLFSPSLSSHLVSSLSLSRLFTLCSLSHLLTQLSFFRTRLDRLSSPLSLSFSHSNSLSLF